MKFNISNLMMLALASTSLTVATAPEAQAENKWEIGGFFGAHLYADDNELGVNDAPGANHLEHSFIAGIRVGYGGIFLDNLHLEGELGVSPSVATNGNADVISFHYRVHPVFYFTGIESKFRPFALVGVGGVYGSSNNDQIIDDDHDFVLPHAGLGFKYRVEHNWGVRLDARGMMPPSSEDDGTTLDWEITAGLYKTFRHEETAPVAPEDGDGDGIVGDADKCPDKAEDKDDFQDDDGCPDLDNDGDGVNDADDKCPSEAGLAEDNGCPKAAPTDNDGDGIVGDADKCPDQAEDKDGFEDEDGCPELDNDGDGVTDAADKCPAEKETPNGYQDGDGCPDEIPAAVQKFSGVIKGIRFASGKSRILRSSFKTLNNAAKVLAEYKGVRLEVQGHTDSRGNAEKNQTLSQARAEAVKAYLEGRGIEGSRLEAKGFGPDKPVASNDTKKGRAENRRVEFKLISNVPTVVPAAPATTTP